MNEGRDQAAKTRYTSQRMLIAPSQSITQVNWLIANHSQLDGYVEDAKA